MINKISEFVTKNMVIWVIIAGIIGYLKPEALTFLKSYIDWLFAITMVGIGAVMNIKDFEPLAKKPQWVVLGTVAQFAIMPLGGFVVAKILNLSPDLALGVIIVGAAPGAMASNVISYLAKADVAYSVALTSTTTLLAPVLTPAFTYLFGKAYINIPFWPMFFSIIKIVIVPLFVGVGIKHFFKNHVKDIVSVFPAISSLFIAFICGLVVALNKNYIAEVSFIVFVAVFMLNFWGLVLGYGAGVLYRFDLKRRRTLSFEVGMQNAGLALSLRLNIFLRSRLCRTLCLLFGA